MATEPQAPIIIKMASLAPANSEWHDALLDMRQKWLEASDGLVELRIFPSGQGGEEIDVIGRMRLGRFQVGGFTLAGLQAITPSVVVLALPWAMETQEDLHRVRAVIGPKLEEVFLERGFVLLHWADLGWMQFFVPDPDPSPAAVMSHKYVEWGDNTLTHVWRDAGFGPGARMAIGDVTMGLQTGLVEAVNTAPLVVAGYSWFRHLPQHDQPALGPPLRSDAGGQEDLGTDSGGVEARTQTDR
jgi:TRAP-type C4-dicarboxylate transport system substrate-binding protein